MTRRRLVLVVVLLGLLWPLAASAQILLETGQKGATPAGKVTSTDCDPDHHCLDMFLRGSTVATGGTSAIDDSVFIGGTTPVTPMGALYDTTPPAITDGRVGIPVMDSARRIIVNCGVGCAGAADTVGTPAALNAANATASVAQAGDAGVGVFLAAGTLAATVVPELSSDGGTTWIATTFYDAAAQTTSASVVLTNPSPATTLSILTSGGISHARVRVSAYTSGTATATLRATAAETVVIGGGGLTDTQLRATPVPVSGTVTATGPLTDAQLRATPVPISGTVTANAGTNLNTSALALEATLGRAQGSTTSGQTGPLIQGAVTTGAPSYTTAQTSPLSLTLAGAVRVDGSAVTQPVSGTVTATGPLTDAQLRATPVPISGTITANAGSGTFAVAGTGTAGAPAGNILTVQGVASMTKLLVTPDSVALPANQSVDVARIAGTGTVTGGVAGLIAVGGNVANAGTATANPVPVGGIFTTTPATLTTGQTATAQFTAAQNLKHDLTTIAGTAPTTAGKLDVKAADGDVFVRQATATNLNAAVVGTGTAGTPAGNILTIQGVASMTKLLVTPDSVALPANQSVNLAQVAGTATVTGGLAGSQGVGGTTAHDGAASAILPVLIGCYANAAAPADVSADLDATRAWCLRNGALAMQGTYAGVLAATGLGNAGTGTPRVVVAKDSDVCNPVDASQFAINVSASGSTELVALTASQTIYVCDLTIVANGTVDAKLVYGTGANCVTGPADITGAMPWVVNTGLTHHYGGRLKTIVSNALCLNLSGAVAVRGVLTYRKAATF